MTEAEHHQMELERMQQLEEAIDRANCGLATEDDWNVIRLECGATQRSVLITSTRK